MPAKPTEVDRAKIAALAHELEEAGREYYRVAVLYRTKAAVGRKLDDRGSGYLWAAKQLRKILEREAADAG